MMAVALRLAPADDHTALGGAAAATDIAGCLDRAQTHLTHIPAGHDHDLLAQALEQRRRS